MRHLHNVAMRLMSDWERMTISLCAHADALTHFAGWHAVVA